jgi:hypothetical protein
MLIYDKMRESKCGCGQKCENGSMGKCTTRRKLPDRFTKKGKKVSAKHIPRAVIRPKFY